MAQEPSPEEKPHWRRFVSMANLRDLAVVLLLLVVTYKTLVTEINIPVEELSVTDLLSLVLALFAIALSAAFYFKASETSNQFYRDTFLFTKQTSELLGRIEAGFGEKLISINQSQGQLRDDLSKMWFRDKSVHADETAVMENEEEQIREKQELVDSRVKELQATVGVLTQQKDFDNKIKQDMREALAKSEAGLSAAQKELAGLRAQKAKDSEKSDAEAVRNGTAKFLLGAILRGTPHLINTRRVNAVTLRVGYDQIRDSLPEAALDQLVADGYISEADQRLTDKGVKVLVALFRSGLTSKPRTT